MADELVSLCECWDIFEAQAIRASFEARGVFAHIDGEHHRGVMPVLGSAVALRIMVKSSQLDLARELAAEIIPGLGHDDEVGDHSWAMLTKNAVLETERVVAGAAVLARAVADTRIEHDSVAWPNACDVRSNRVDHADTVGPQDPALPDSYAGNSFDHPKVEVVQRSRLNSHAHVIRRPELRRWNIVSKLHLIECAVRVDR